MNKKQIGKNIQKYRKKNHYTQEQLAELLDISKVHLSHIEIGERSASLSLILSCCNVLSVTPNDLLEGAYHNKIIESLILNAEDGFDQSNLTSAITSMNSEDREIVIELMRLFFTRRKRVVETELEPVHPEK